MEIAKRAKFMANYDPATTTGNLVRKLLVVMVLTEIEEDKKYQQLSKDCESLLVSLSENPLLHFAPLAIELLDVYEELNDGIGIEEA